MGITGKYDRTRNRHRIFSVEDISLWNFIPTFSSLLTIPVSADRCCDWKNTASSVLHLGQALLERGS